VLRRVQLTPLNHDDDEIIRTICGTGESEGDGDVSQDLVGSTFRLARQTNIKPYDVLIDHERLIITDNAKRLRQVFICDYPDISDIAVTPETICIGDSVTLSLSDSLKDAEMWNWYISDECSSTEMPYGHGQSIKVFVENDFDISVSASGGCIVNQDCVTESFELTCKEFYNTFTPNGDGKNDFFEINTVLNYPLNTVSIYNRWGVLLNKIENYDNETNVWTGTNEGDVAVGSGTYFFTFESGGETILSGWIELIK
jgi:gliding motility-associated-like protein